MRPLRALDASICLSVAQEELAFALAIAAETYLSAEKKKEETGEETNFFQPSVVIGAIILSSGLVYSRNELLGRVGLLFTSIAAFAVIGNYAKRFLDAGESASPRRSSSLSLWKVFTCIQWLRQVQFRSEPFCNFFLRVILSPFPKTLCCWRRAPLQ